MLYNNVLLGFWTFKFALACSSYMLFVKWHKNTAYSSAAFLCHFG